jgi:hypothetical protein
MLDCKFHQDTVEFFKLGRLYAFYKNEQLDICPVTTGNAQRKVCGKAIAIDYKVRWKEAVGVRQFGIGTPAGVDIVLLKTENTLAIYPDFSSLTVDGRNAFNSADRQKFLNKLYEKFPELSLFIEVWYLGRVELWFFFEDGSVGVIASFEGCQQGDKIAQFVFDLGVLENIFIRLQQLDNRSEIMVIHDDLTINILSQLAAQAFQICTEEWAQI